MKEKTCNNTNMITESDKVIDLIDRYAEDLRLNGSLKCMKYQKI